MQAENTKKGRAFDACNRRKLKGLTDFNKDLLKNSPGGVADPARLRMRAMVEAFQASLARAKKSVRADANGLDILPAPPAGVLIKQVIEVMTQSRAPKRNSGIMFNNT